jgi:hypothetical protein
MVHKVLERDDLARVRMSWLLCAVIRDDDHDDIMDRVQYDHDYH